ncbi:MAG: hypothetical protein LBB56_03835 [Chitinispirillales bacterium]|jgi:hypothetical protein|nr:hypothetical protein [Chitinispirillales bacterium]
MRFGEFNFYKTDKLSIKEKIGLLNECKEICYQWRADKLDCTVSFSRQKLDCSFEEILEHLHEDSHFVVIDRGIWGSFDNKEHFEVGFRSMEPVDYFLFIEVESNKMPPVLEKYKLV